MFDGEFASLDAIYKTNKIQCPKPIKVIYEYLILLFVSKALPYLSFLGHETSSNNVLLGS